MKRYTILAAVLMAAATFAFAKGAGEDTAVESSVVTAIEAPVEIEFWHAMSGGLGEAVDHLVAEFNAGRGAELGITVTAINQGGYGDLKQKTTAAIKAGEAPAVAQAYTDWILEFMQAGVIPALDDYINHSEVGIADLDDIFPGYLAENSQYADGKFHSLPFNKSTEVIFYNKTLFDANGYKIPATWDDLEKLSAQIYADTGKPAFGYDSLDNFVITTIYQNGGEYINGSGDVLFKNDEKLAAAVAMYKKNFDAGYWRIAGEDRYISGPFNNGDVAMYIGSTAGASYVGSDAFEWFSAPLPQTKGGKNAAIQQGTNVFVTDQNKTPAEVYAAYEFVKYLVSAEGNLYWATHTGYLPIRQSVVDSAEYKAFLAEGTDSTKVSGPSQSGYYFFDPGFYGSDYTSYDVRVATRTIMEDVLLNGTEPMAAIQAATSRFK